VKYLIVGLGNIGEEYIGTRHNIGFSVLDAFAKASNVVFSEDRLAHTTTCQIKGRTLILIKPTTFMNLSGKALNYWMQKEKIPIENVLIIVDDLSLPFGVIRLRPKGSDGGHNGLKDIAETLGHENYARLKFGIGNDFPKGHQVQYVLGKWTPEEALRLSPRISQALNIIKDFAFLGMERCMSMNNNK